MLDELKALAEKASPGDWEWDAGIVPPDGPGRYADIYVLDKDREPITLFEFNDSLPEGRSNAALIVALRNNLPAIIAALEDRDRLRVALEQANTPHWFYADGWEERCMDSPHEVIDFLDLDVGSHVVEVATGKPCKPIWCAVTVNDDEDEHYTFTEHASEEAARAALKGDPF